MPRRIHVLPDRLVNQIAAGEVVERPASVVKELVENALDAGARRVDVAIRNGGKTEIRVADDGWGMSREDALLALDRHATSKIRDEADLASIRTLGFRGEALPSIASVSRMAVETAERDGDGTRVIVSGGLLGAVETCARRTGTTIAVRSLFFNVPARAKFLRSAAVEARAISETMIAVALAHPEVAFTLESNGRPLLELPVVSDVRARVGDVWGGDSADELIAIAHSDAAGGVTGWIQRPHGARPGARRSYAFVNGRHVTDRLITRAAYRGYRTTIPAGVSPSLFLFVDLADDAVDVNVHPTKAEVRFRHPFDVERMVEEGVRGTLGTLASAPGLGRSGTDAAAGAGTGAASHGPRPAPTGAPADEAPAGGRARIAAEAPLDQMSLFVAGGAAPAVAPAPAHADPFVVTAPEMWQIHSTYILAETRAGLILVDQHSAHERVLYEELMRDFSASTRVSQRLLFPMTLRLSAAEYAVVAELGALFAQAGFEIEPFGGRSVIVHSVPVPHPYFDAERCLREMIGELAGGSDLVDSARTQHQRIALTFACKAAIKAGQKLSPAEMRELFDRLFATELPYHDIHGRPTVVQIGLQELHGRFRRHG